ncbi:hypothetical protein [uncultured Clostridium sp.]|uniref:hypothetical protein n=1 Tax=uncultured Clostridium sp. TaxID=59620 RepID=UPI00258E135D|nr:hypothetical protein [uncultured Clostridium sp.]
MRKPSIFSRDYERQMRKRRKRIFLVSLLGILLIGLLFAKIAMSSINMETLRNKVQNWIDEDNNIQENPIVKEEISEEEEPKEETPKEELKTMDLVIKEGIILKAEYEETNEGLKFKGIKDTPNNIYYALNPNRNLILTIDEKQDMKIFNIDKKEASINKDKYIAPNGEIFNKESVLQSYEGYLWNVEAKFIDNTKIAYISNLPYFGYNLSKYIWIVDLNDNSHKTLWNSKGKDIKFGDIKEKGLEVTIDSSIKFINSNGELIN